MNEASQEKERLKALMNQGEEILVQADTRFFLREHDVLWFVQGEGGDVFFYNAHDTNAPPIYLIPVESNGVLLGATSQVESKEYSLFFISTRKTTLRKIPLPVIKQEFQKSQELRLAFSHLIEHWIFHLLSFFTLPQEPERIKRYFKWDDNFSLKQGEYAALEKTLIPEEKQRISWVSVQEGKCNFLGVAEFPLPQKGISFPLSLQLWIQSETDASVICRSTEKALETPTFWDGIIFFHQELFVEILKKKKEDLERILLRIQRKAQYEEEITSSTYLKLGAILNKRIVAAPSMEESPLFKACDLIGQALKVKIVFPSFIEQTLDTEGQIREIASTSNLQYRRVGLHDAWWKEAAQNILGFYGEKKEPIALLKTKKGYLFANPAQGFSVPLTPELAKDISSRGYVFYAGFPEKKPNLFQVLKTAFKANFREVFDIIFVAFAGGAVNLFLPFAMKQLFDTLILTDDVNLLTQFTIGLLVSAFSMAIFTITKNYASFRIDGISNNKLESTIWMRILDLPANFFRRFESGTLMATIQAFQKIRTDVSENMVKFILSSVYCLFYLVMMFFYSWIFTLLGLAVLFVAFGIFAVCTYYNMRLQEKSYDAGRKIQGIVVQIISGIAKIRVAGAESRFFAIWGDLFSTKKKLDLKLQMINAIQSLVYRIFPLIMTTLLFTCAIVILKGALYQKQGGTAPITIGTFLGFNTAYSLFALSALDILSMMFAMSSIFSYWKLAKPIVEAPTEERSITRSIRLKGGVSIEHVFFRYEKDADLILKDVSFHANPGEMIGIVGKTGCGKSTLVRLLLGFETPEQGEVFYDEQPMKNFDPRSIRKQIGTVLQNAGILAGSIYENIVGAGSYSKEDIERALRLSGFSKDLADLPMGLNTVVPMGGNTFSGGQRQRLYLARALVASPKILILDEATSALDNKTQEFVSANLDEIAVTRIVIAHRLSTIKHADRIYVMDAGEIIESGTFNELVEKNGLFAAMLKRQQV